MQKGNKKASGRKAVARNKRATFDYEILERFEAGIVLMGTEVKSLREGVATIAESHARISNGEAWLVGAHIPPFKQASIFNHEPDRKRKLLLNRREIDKIKAQLDRKGLSLIPLELYFDARGMVKLNLGLGRGLKRHDKRQALRKKTDRREMDRAR